MTETIRWTIKVSPGPADDFLLALKTTAARASSTPECCRTSLDDSPQFMRIGLLRHFPVSEDLPRGWLRSSELHDWRSRYDRADAVVGEFDLGPTLWQVCISSDLPRALTTAIG